MTSAVYLEQYLDSLENLPNETRRNLTLMRDLDVRSSDHLKRSDELCERFLRNIRSYSDVQKKDVLNSITKANDEAKTLVEDKVQLAIQTYELVDKHIRRLDSDLARFEAEIQSKAMNTVRSNNGNAATTQKRGPTRKKANEKNLKPSASVEIKKTIKKSPNLGITRVPGSTIFNTVDGHVIDMPVDPNEPRYCLCNQVSYGEMIGCDNTECPIEWFHFACVQLTTKPKGKWYCPNCSADMKKK